MLLWSMHRDTRVSCAYVVETHALRGGLLTRRHALRRMCQWWPPVQQGDGRGQQALIHREASQTNDRGLTCAPGKCPAPDKKATVDLSVCLINSVKVRLYTPKKQRTDSKKCILLFSVSHPAVFFTTQRDYCRTSVWWWFITRGRASLISCLFFSLGTTWA